MRFLELRTRYLRDPLPIRLGNLAANLARIGSMTPDTKRWPYIERNVAESKYFIEWTALDMPEEFQDDLIELQVKLSTLHRRGSAAPSTVADLCSKAQQWSDQVLAMMRAIGVGPSASDAKASS